MKIASFLFFTLLSFLIANLLSLVIFMVLKFNILVVMKIFEIPQLGKSLDFFYFLLFASIFFYLLYKIYAKIFKNQNIMNKNFSYFLIVSYFFILNALLSALMFSFGLKKDLSDILLLGISTFAVLGLSIYGSFALNSLIDKKFIKFLSEFLDK